MTIEEMRILEQKVIDDYFKNPEKQLSMIVSECRGNPIVLGNVLTKIKKHKENAERDTREICSESDTKSESITGAIDKEKSREICEDGISGGQTEGEREEDEEITLCEKISGQIWNIYNGLTGGEKDFYGYRCFWYIVKRCCCLRKFRKQT